VLVGSTLSVPLVASVPVQPPLAVQEVAFVLDQVKVELLQDVIAVGLADRVTVGAGAAETVTVAVASDEVPPAPVQVSLYVVVLTGLTLNEPLVASVPVQPPLAVQDVAFVLDQVSVALPPAAMDAGLAVKVTMGASEFVNPRFET